MQILADTNVPEEYVADHLFLRRVSSLTSFASGTTP